jgi:hypothetical protein
MTLPPIQDKNGNQYTIGCRYRNRDEVFTLAWHEEDLTLFAIDSEGEHRSIRAWVLNRSEIILTEKGCPFDA